MAGRPGDNEFDLDFELPPLPPMKKLGSEAAADPEPLLSHSDEDLTSSLKQQSDIDDILSAPDASSEAETVIYSSPAPKEASKRPLNIDDILSAPNNATPVPPPKMTVDTSTVKNITSEESLEKTMEAAKRALGVISENSRVPFEPEPEPEEEVFPPADTIPEHSPDPESVVLEEMGGNNRSSSAALKNMILMDEMSMEMTDKPILDDLSSDYTTARQKARGDDLSRKDSLSLGERKAIRDRLHEEIYRRPENFSSKQEKYLEQRLKAENRLKKARKGLLITILAMFLTLGCAASTYVGLHDYNELFTYLAAGTLIAGLMLLIKSKNAKLFSTVYLALNTLTLAVPGLAMMVITGSSSVPDFDKYVVWFGICIALSGAALFILSTSRTAAIYFSTDSEGNER